MPTRKAKAEWQGGLKDGKGKIKFESGAYEGPYSFQSRFESGTGTNPEELIAAAHAGCFSMAFSKILGDAGHTPKMIQTSAGVSLEKKDAGFEITKIHLETEAKIDGINDAQFQELAEKAKKGCPVSKALSSVNITMTAKLAQGA